MQTPVYLDNNATTQLAPGVVDAMAAAMECYGNPSSAHALGKESRQIVSASRESVAHLLGAASSSEIVFTSGGTESDNLAILGSLAAGRDKNHIVTTTVEHEAVRKLCEHLEARGKRVTWIGVDERGSLNLDQLQSSLGDDTGVVSVMMANNETGVIFPVAEIAEIVKERSDALFHVDGVNAAGKIPINLKHTKIDLFSVSAHKFHGPKGVGALYIREGVKLASQQIGGGQELGRRAGTEPVHQIAGFGAAADFVRDLSSLVRLKELRDHLESSILEMFDLASINGDTEHRLPNTSNISFENLNGEMILHYLDEAGICVSTGSACNSESKVASPVLAAMDVPYSRAMGSIRFSLGRFNSKSEIEKVLGELPGIIEKLSKMSF